MKQYEIWLADLNPRRGSEPGKVRPVVVIQTDLLNEHHVSTLVCPLTTNIRTGSTILRVHLAAGEAGLSEACDVMIDQVRAIDNRRFVNKIGRVSARTSDKIKLNLKVIFDLE